MGNCEFIDTKDNWSLRKSLVLKKVYKDMDKLIAANKNDTGLSLVVFYPPKTSALSLF